MELTEEEKDLKMKNVVMDLHAVIGMMDTIRLGRRLWSTVEVYYMNESEIICWFDAS